MCLSCGCKQPNEDHGDNRHIVMSDIEAAAQAAEMTPDQVTKNLQQGYQEFGTAEIVGVGVGSQGQGQTQREGQTQGQSTGNNESSFEDRQGGYSSGSSNGPQ